jgi:flagellar protein FlbD
MIKVTNFDGSEKYLNSDLIESIEETPDTHITMSNGNRYLVLEPTQVVIGRIVSFKVRLMRGIPAGGKRYLHRNRAKKVSPS